MEGYPPKIREFIEKNNLQSLCKEVEKLDEHPTERPPDYKEISTSPVPFVSNGFPDPKELNYDTHNEYVYADALSTYGFTYNTKTACLIYVHSLENTYFNRVYMLNKNLKDHIHSVLTRHKMFVGKSQSYIATHTEQVLNCVKLLMIKDKLHIKSNQLRRECETFQLNTPGQIFPMNYPDIILPYREIFLCSECFLSFSIKHKIDAHMNSVHPNGLIYKWIGQRYGNYYQPVMISNKLSHELNNIDGKEFSSISKNDIPLLKNDLIKSALEIPDFIKSMTEKELKNNVIEFCLKLRLKIFDKYSAIIKTTNLEELEVEWYTKISKEKYQIPMFFSLHDDYYINISWLLPYLNRIHELAETEKREFFSLFADISQLFIIYLYATNPIYPKLNIDLFNQMDNASCELRFVEKNGFILFTSDNVPTAILKDPNLTDLFIFVFGPLRYFLMCLKISDDDKNLISLFTNKPDSIRDLTLELWDNIKIPMRNFKNLIFLFLEKLNTSIINSTDIDIALLLKINNKLFGDVQFHQNNSFRNRKNIALSEQQGEKRTSPIDDSLAQTLHKKSKV